MKQFSFVPACDLVRCKVGNTVWYVHRGWLYGNWPRKTYEGDGERKPKAALNGGTE